MTRRKGCSLVTVTSDITETSQKEERFYVVRRTNEDKRKAVQTLLDDPEWGKWSDNEIAKRCNVSHDTVRRIKKENLTCRSSSENPEDIEKSEKRYINKHGNESVMN